jgi:hypothetical protein
MSVCVCVAQVITCYGPRNIYAYRMGGERGEKKTSRRRTMCVAPQNIWNTKYHCVRFWFFDRGNGLTLCLYAPLSYAPLSMPLCPSLYASMPLSLCLYAPLSMPLCPSLYAPEDSMPLCPSLYASMPLSLWLYAAHSRRLKTVCRWLYVRGSNTAVELLLYDSMFSDSMFEVVIQQ